MDAVRDYLLRVICAALIIGIIGSMIGKKGSTAALIRLTGGLYLSFVLIQPLIRFDWDTLTAFAENYEMDAEAFSAQGEQMAREEYERIIKDRTEAYILDKARTYNLDLEVDVTLVSGNPPVPDSVRIQGAASPYARQMLQKMIYEDLGIREEAQEWIP